MYRHEKFYIAGNRFSVRIHDQEYHSFTFNRPNPGWKDFGERWLKIALNKEYLQKLSVTCIDVAYLPSNHFRIIRGSKEDNILPTKWDLDELPQAANLVMAVKTGFFRIQGCYLACDGGYIGSKKNVDLNPMTDSDLILNLLKVAEKIYTP